MFSDRICSSVTLTFVRYLSLSKRAFTLSPVLVIAAPISFTTISWLVRGCPRQFMLM